MLVFDFKSPLQCFISPYFLKPLLVTSSYGIACTTKNDAFIKKLCGIQIVHFEDHNACTVQSVYIKIGKKI